MTERGAGAVERDARSLHIGPSSLHWDGEALTIAIDEVTAPWPSRVRGQIRVVPTSLHDVSYALDDAGRHQWQPIAPYASVEVDLLRPASGWRGFGYLDSNRGGAPLEQDFRRWHWSRTCAPSGRTTVLYDVTRRDGSERALVLAFDPGASAAAVITAPPLRALAPSAWRIARAMRCSPGHQATVVETLEDGPFYARSLVRSRLGDEDVIAVHESLDLDRFASPWVQAMLPFRMPRRA